MTLHLHLKEREVVYVTEQGQVINSDAVTGVLTKGISCQTQ